VSARTRPGPSVVEVLRDAFLAAELLDAVLAAQAFKNDADFLLGRELPPGRAADIPVSSALFGTCLSRCLVVSPSGDDEPEPLFGAFEMDTGSAVFNFYGVGGAGWVIAGTGEFSGDGTSDVLWLQTATSAFGAFEMDTGSAVFNFYGVAGAGWEVAGTGDFSGDGTSDILWRQTSTNAFGAFEMDTGSAVFDFYGVGGAGWVIAGTGDYSGDGTADVLWNQISTNAFGAFEMDTGTPTFTFYGVGGAGWEIV